MVASAVDYHVVLRRHMAVGAGGALGAHRVVMVFRSVIAGGFVALGTDAVTRRSQFVAVRFVAVGADHARLVHLALHKGAVDIDLVENLAIGVIQRIQQQRRAVGVQQRAPVPVVSQGAAAGVASTTAFHLLRALQRLAAQGDILTRRPGPGPAFGETHREAAALTPLQRAGLGQLHMGGPRSVAGFAGHVDFRPGGAVAAALGVVVLFEIGAVALGALQVPVLVGAGPVQRVTGDNGLVRVEVKPALAPVFGGARIPGNPEGLQASAREGDQVLLQRLDAEHVVDAVVGQLAVRALGIDPELIALAVEAAGFSGVVEACVPEIRQHRVGRCHLHGEVVVRALPGGEFLGVTACAGLGAHIVSVRLEGGVGSHGGEAQEQQCE